MKAKLLAALCCLLMTICAIAQESTAGVQGVVKDQTGAVISGATVTLTSPALIGKKTVTTDGNGLYHVEQLPPGTYDITVEAKGFSSQTQKDLKLATGALPNVNAILKLGSASETVEVSAEAAIVDVTQVKVQANVTEEILQGIPKGRSFQSVIPFAAGARQEPLQGTTTGRTNGFQIDGASDSENVYLQDGVNITNIQNGGVGKSFQMDFTNEVQVKSSSYEAEFGGALGGVINVIPKHGSNSWHGEGKAYYQSSALNASDPCASGYTANGFSTVCGLRQNPALAPLSTKNRLDGTPQYYIPKKDNRRTIEPGFEIGGPILRDKLWLYTSYVPSLDFVNRATTFVGKFNGFVPDRRVETASTIQHNAYTRLDYRMFNSLNLFGSWNYGYARQRGILGQPDSAYGQKTACGDLACSFLVNGSSTDPSTLRPDNGTVFPLSVYAFGGDWTPTSKLVVSARYGYFYNNAESRGVPQGTRYIWDNTSNANTKDLTGATMPSNTFGSGGFATIPSNFTQFYNVFYRKSINTDVSYFVGSFLGSHTFKTGYFWQSQYNGVLNSSNGAWVDLNWGATNYTPVTSTTACDSVIQGNIAAGLPGQCQGRYGYFFTGSTAVSNTGHTNATDQAVYVQDSWTVGHTGLTINAGIRMDSEKNPAFDKTRFPDLDFGWGEKIAPRIGGAYDLLHNGKVKVFGSYGKFFDIMKLGLTRGSFGSDYWHNCVYALDTANYQSILPTLATQGGCPASGPAPGLGNGTMAQGWRFIENVDFRATKADPRDPAIQPNMKPVQNHEMIAGVDWAISPTLSLETRYSHKRLDNTIEDMSITDNLGFYIGNPGSHFADVLHRPVVIPDAAGNNYLNTTPFCAECPGAVKAIRNYDGVEFRLTKQAGSRWFGSMTYAYSQLRGNYSGLTDTDPTDGGGGRHSPNNGRAFDLPTMTYLPSGKIDNGPLATDRPNTAKFFGYYRLPWLGQETLIGVSQAMFQGTPISACLPVVGTSSACQWAEGRGNMPKLSRDPATGNIVMNGVVKDARSDAFFQTDLTLRHEIKVSKSHESWRAVFEANGFNMLNQHAAVGYYQFVIPTGLVSPSRASRFSGDPQVDWGAVMNGYNYIDALNGANAFAGKAAPRTLASRYGLPQVFQSARQFRLAMRFTF